MTVERAMVAFKLKEPVVFQLTGTKFTIDHLIIKHSIARSLLDHINGKDKNTTISFVLCDPNGGTTYRVDASQLEETCPAPPKDYTAMIIKGLVGC